jgi:hypothetical protein
MAFSSFFERNWRVHFYAKRLYSLQVHSSSSGALFIIEKPFLWIAALSASLYYFEELLWFRYGIRFDPDGTSFRE